MTHLPTSAADHALLDAGLRLLGQGRRAAELQPSALAAEAGLPVAAFAERYPESTQFLLDLLQRLLDEARESATEAVSQAPDNLNGLKRGIEAYMDGHLRRPAMRELTLLLRDRESAQAIIGRRIAGFHRVLQVGLSALHSLYPLAGAQLLTAMIVETTQAEYEARRPLPELREALYAYLDRLVP